MKGMKRVAVACLCAVTVFGFAGCREKEIVSAYDIAVKNGFAGTEKEWLLSLKGADGKDAEDLNASDFYLLAKENGYEGSWQDFIRDYIDADVQENNDTRTIAENMSSVVSIYSAFSKTKRNWAGEETTEYYGSAGSGVIMDISKDNGSALILTNYHVVYDSESDSGISECIYLYGYGGLCQFKTNGLKGDVGGDGMKASYVGGAMDYDIAILKIEGNEVLKNSMLTAAKMGDSEEVVVGEKVFAIGNPDADGISVTGGLVSVCSEYITLAATDGTNRSVSYRVMRTDAAINGGNSGGGLFNAQGELIGIVNAKTVDEDIDNMGYALPITQVLALCDNITDNGGVLKRAILGTLVVKNKSYAVFNENGTLDRKEEFFVSKKAEEGSAAYGKLEYGDIFKSIKVVPNGEDAENCQEILLDKQYLLHDVLMRVRFGDKVILKIKRGAEELTVEIVYDDTKYFKKYA